MQTLGLLDEIIFIVIFLCNKKKIPRFYKPTVLIKEEFKGILHFALIGLTLIFHKL